jgi:hypothetical protein
MGNAKWGVVNERSIEAERLVYEIPQSLPILHSPFRYLHDQHRIAVAVEAIFVRDCLFIRLPN